MENNAIINSRLKELLEVLDARAAVDIFIMDNERGKEYTSILRSARVYELLADNEFMKKYGRDYEVIGLTCGLINTILIDKER